MKYPKMEMLCLSALMVGMPVHATTTLFDDFSSSVTMDKYWGMEETIELNTTSGNLEFLAGSRGYLKNSKANNLTLIDVGTSLLQADLTLFDATLSNPESQQAMLGIAGTYYNAESANPGDNLGEVFVRLAIGDRGNGPEAWYELQVSTSETWDTSSIITGSFGGVDLNRAYTASIAYDGDNSFSIDFDNGTAVVIDGPPRVGPAFDPVRYLNNRVRLGQDNSTDDQGDSLLDVNAPVFIAGAVDNVVTDSGLIDDFSDNDIDEGVWAQDQTSVTVDAGGLLMKVTGQGSQVTEQLWIKKKGLSAIGATLTLLSSGTVNDSARLRGRLTHFLSNDTYDVANGDIANGSEGFVWTQFLIEREDGENRAVVYAERAADADWETGDELFWIDLGSINLDQPYALLIEKSGSRVDYRLDGELVHTFDLASDHSDVLSGNDYAPIGETETGLQVRISDDAGEAQVVFDDVVTDYQPEAIVLKVFDQSNTEINFPGDVIVHEDEVVDLVASVGDSSKVVAYIWDQVSGTEVTVSAGKFRQRPVGNDQSLSFTVPPGTNLETLGFDLTVVDQAGVQVSRPFEFKVDNSVERTLARTSPTTKAKTSKGSSSGGGVFNPLMLVFGCLLVSAIAGFRRSTR
jgi:hypothetical protein